MSQYIILAPTPLHAWSRLWVFCSAFITQEKRKKTPQIHSFLTKLNTDSKSLKMRCTPPVNALKLLKTNKIPADEKVNCLSHFILAQNCCEIMHQ